VPQWHIDAGYFGAAGLPGLRCAGFFTKQAKQVKFSPSRSLPIAEASCTGTVSHRIFKGWSAQQRSAHGGDISAATRGQAQQDHWLRARRAEQNVSSRFL